MTNDKFILMGLDDDRAGYIAEVLKNPTCKKMLDFLADIKEASEKDIADGLAIPINTAEYNLEKLVKSGLVEKTKNFFWSVKGKKIPMYKLVKKHIIISPNKKPDLNYLKSILPIILAIAILVVLGGLFLFPKENPITDQNQIKQFQSQEDLNNFIKQNSGSNQDSNLFRGFGGAQMAVETMSEGAAPIATATAEKSADSSAVFGVSDYSTTNIQVEGVDEADIVKNDGKYIYVVSGNKLKIIDAYPAGNMKVLSEMKISGISNLYINNDKLIVFSNSYNYGIYPYDAEIAKDSISSDSIMCVGCGYGESLSLVYIYDISDRENPVLDRNLSVEGNYIDSRMIDNFIYIVSTKYVNTENPEPPIYIMNGVMEKVSANEVYYWPYQDASYVFTSIIAVNIENGEFNNKVYLTGSTNNIFVSQDNIYLTYQKTTDYKEYAKKIAEEVYYPILPREYDNKIKEVLDSDKNNWEKLREMQEIVNNYANSLESGEISDFSSNLMEKLEKFNIKLQKETEKTAVHKINVDKGNIEYKGVGGVPGTILNQFSMDEFNGYFRVATTTGNWRETSLNHLYVLDEDLKIVGSVEDLAKGERIYSVRFLGERAYMVTFKQVDPLFVIELSNPEKPEVLGYLKITGFSDYLHPYDKNHIIGIGKQATEEGRIEGMKIALFDVSDVANPKEKAKIEIGDRGTESAALYNHKAFLFNKEKELLVLPMSVYESKEIGDEFSRRIGSDIVFNGAYVFNIDDEEISLRGKITHFDKASKYGPAKYEPIGTKREIYGQTYIKIGENSWEMENNYYDKYSRIVYTDEYIDQQPGGINYNNLYDYKYQIQRSLYIDNVLYTISNAEIKANDLDSINEINSLDLKYEEDYYPYLLYGTASVGL